MSASIVIDLGDMAEHRQGSALFREAGALNAAIAGMRDSMRSFGGIVQRAAAGLSRMGDYAKGVVSALMHAQNLAQGLDSGLRNLYRWGQENWEPFASTLDGLAASALYLKNSFAAMAAPLINTVAPAIHYVTDCIVTLFNLAGQLVARLSGSQTYVAARRTGEAWSAVGGRIGRATSALRRYVAGFDQLNVLQSGASGRGGGGGGGVAGMFETRTIESGLRDFADRLREAFQAGDWAGLGQLLGEQVNAIVDSVDWAGLGTKVGYYVNGLFSTAYWTLDAINFANIGASAAEFLNNALAEIDFTTAGGTVALLFTTFWETVAGFITGFDWPAFAADLADGVNGFVTTLDKKLSAVDWAGLALRLTDGINSFIQRTHWKRLGKALGRRVNDLLSVLGTAAAKFDWTGAGAALAASVNGLFESVNWDALGDWLNNTLLGVLDLGLSFFDDFDAKGFADGIGRALSRVDWDAMAEKLWALFKAALMKLGEFFGALLFGGSANLSLNLSLLRSGWTTITKWLGIDNPLAALIRLGKSGWTTIGSFVGTAVTVLTSLGRNGWTSIGSFVGTAVTVLTSLEKNGWSSISAFVGTAVTVLTSLGRSGWTSIGSFVGTAVTVLTSLGKSGWSSISAFVGTAVTVLTSLGKSGWSSISAFVGTAVTVLTSLGKSGWTSIGGFVGTAVTVLTSLGKNGWTSISAFVGTAVTVLTSLGKAGSGPQTAEAVYSAADKAVTGKTSLAKGSSGDQTVKSVYSQADKAVTGYTSLAKASSGTQNVSGVYSASEKAVTGNVSLAKSGWTSISAFVGTAVTTKVTLSNSGTNWASGLLAYLTGNTKGEATVKVNLTNGTGGTTWVAMTKALGGIITAGGRSLAFASGGLLTNSGRPRWWDGVQKYAAGTSRAHGTLFAAGEAGPEIVGHINGRTEILNKSQLAQTMFSAVASGMLYALSKVRLSLPAVATGGAVPYEVAARISEAGEAIEDTLNANNEDLIQTIISVIGAQTSAIVAALQQLQRGGDAPGGMSLRQIIEGLNRQTQMYGASPLM